MMQQQHMTTVKNRLNLPNSVQSRKRSSRREAAMSPDVRSVVLFDKEAQKVQTLTPLLPVWHDGRLLLKL